MKTEAEINFFESKRCDLCLGSKFFRFKLSTGKKKGQEQKCPKCGGSGVLTKKL